MVVATRIVLSTLCVLGAIQAGLLLKLQHRYPASYVYAAGAVVLFLVFAVGWLAGGLAGQGLARGLRKIEKGVQNRSAGELTISAIGLVFGLIVAALLYFPVHALPIIGAWLLLPMFLILGYLFAVVGARKHRGILRMVGVHVMSDSGGDPEDLLTTTLIDTSAIIDGRIADIARTGFLEGELVVPEFVLRELQQVADSADPLKRARGRRGLEVVQEMRGDVPLSTPEIDFPELGDVDAKLLKLAKQRGMRILTTDFNLNRLARIQDVIVLNVNDLANALKPAVLPGERLELRLLREGKEIDQAVGYLDDGTMVVVEGARKRIGATVSVEVTSVLQSPSGKMIFTRLAQAG